MNALALYIVTLVVFSVLIAYLVWMTHKERERLINRIIAMSHPGAALIVAAQEDKAPGNVTYMDEAREAELSPSWAGA